MSLSEVEANGVENEIGLAVSAIVKGSDDPARAMADISYITFGAIPSIELVSERIQLPGDVVVLFSDPTNTRSETPGPFR